MYSGNPLSWTPWKPGDVSWQLYREVPSFQGKICIKIAYLGHSKVSFFQGCLFKRGSTGSVCDSLYI